MKERSFLISCYEWIIRHFKFLLKLLLWFFDFRRSYCFTGTIGVPGATAVLEQVIVTIDVDVGIPISDGIVDFFRYGHRPTGTIAKMKFAFGAVMASAIEQVNQSHAVFLPS